MLATHPADVAEIHPAERLQGPSAAHLLGTDRMGGDIYSRLLFGARITIVIALVAVGASLLIGVPIGLLAGYYRTWFSEMLMRVSDIFLAVPQIVLAIAIAQTLGPSIENVILALSVTYWPFLARLVYAETRSALNNTFIEASIALGASPMRVLFLHVLPNIASSIIVRTTIGMGFTILTAAALGFLGLGPPPPTPEWGRTIAESREFLPDAWWYATAPGLAIFLVVMGFNLLGDGLRDILDPRTRGAGNERQPPRRRRSLRQLRHRRRARAGARSCDVRHEAWRDHGAGRRSRAAARPRWRAPSSAFCRPTLRTSRAVRSASTARTCCNPIRPTSPRRVRGRTITFIPQDPFTLLQSRVHHRRPDHGADEMEVAARTCRPAGIRAAIRARAARPTARR